MTVLCCVIAFIGGCIIAFANYLLSSRTLKKTNSKMTDVSVVTIVRQLLSVIYLVALYFVAKIIEVNLAWFLLMGALGLTLPLLYFSIKLLREINNKKDKGDD